MPRPKKIITDPKKRKQHEAALARKRARHAEKKHLAAASLEAEGAADLHALKTAPLSKTKLAATKGGKASPTRIAAARENLSEAFDLMGGVAGLVKWGKSNPTEFYRIWSRLIPKESVEVSAQLPLEALLQKLSSRESMTVGEAAYQIGTEVLEDARNRVIEADAYVTNDSSNWMDRG